MSGGVLQVLYHLKLIKKNKKKQNIAGDIRINRPQGAALYWHS